jgi:hypothetical protein
MTLETENKPEIKKKRYVPPLEERKPMTVLEAYNDLNETKKKIVKMGFIAKFEYSEKSDIFYKKIKRETPIKTIEKEWFAERLKLPINELFPDIEENTEID